MPPVVIKDDRVAEVRFPSSQFEVELKDGRILSTPQSWYPRLARATREQRAHRELSAAEHGIHWREIDEDLSVAGMLRGRKAPRGN